jgi:hypothetical protein
MMMNFPLERIAIIVEGLLFRECVRDLGKEDERVLRIVHIGKAINKERVPHIVHTEVIIAQSLTGDIALAQRGESDIVLVLNQRFVDGQDLDQGQEPVVGESRLGHTINSLLYITMMRIGKHDIFVNLILLILMVINLSVLDVLRRQETIVLRVRLGSVVREELLS